MKKLSPAAEQARKNVLKFFPDARCEMQKGSEGGPYEKVMWHTICAEYVHPDCWTNELGSSKKSEDLAWQYAEYWANDCVNKRMMDKFES